MDPRKTRKVLAGERMSLCLDIPQYRRPRAKELSGESAKVNQQERCIQLIAEGGYSKACEALTSSPHLGQSPEVCAKLRENTPAVPVQPI